jgi:hypothetical protein
LSIGLTGTQSGSYASLADFLTSPLGRSYDSEAFGRTDVWREEEVHSRVRRRK